MGIVEDCRNSLGVEGSGMVIRTGPGVKHLQPGDRVYFFGRGCFRTNIALSEQACARIPEDLSLQDAATIPSVFTTVVEGLLNRARLEKGQVCDFTVTFFCYPS
jgi:NADPH:quinone reductase-like Zn-dependent oxidoreductase